MSERAFSLPGRAAEWRIRRSGDIEIDATRDAEVLEGCEGVYYYEGGRWRASHLWLKAEEVSRRLQIPVEALHAAVLAAKAVEVVTERREREEASRRLEMETIWARQDGAREALRLAGEGAHVAHDLALATSRREALRLRFDARETEPGVPEALRDVQGVEQLQCVGLGHVYFLLRQGEVVYVGQTRASWPNRIIEHLASGEKDFDDVWYIRCACQELNEVEAHWIAYFRPEHNKARMS